MIAELLELLRTTGSLLTRSYWGILVPIAVFLWQWVVVMLLWLMWLIVGGVASLPLIIEGARYLCRRVRRWRWLKAVVWFLAAVVAWLYAHLWIASIMWHEAHVFHTENSGGIGGSCLILFILWLVGLAIWWAVNHPQPSYR